MMRPFNGCSTALSLGRGRPRARSAYHCGVRDLLDGWVLETSGLSAWGAYPSCEEPVFQAARSELAGDLECCGHFELTCASTTLTGGPAYCMNSSKKGPPSGRGKIEQLEWARRSPKKPKAKSSRWATTPRATDGGEGKGEWMRGVGGKVSG